MRSGSRSRLAPPLRSEESVRLLQVSTATVKTLPRVLDGFHFTPHRRERSVPDPSSVPPAQLKATLDSILASLKSAIALIRGQDGIKKKWDVDNLEKALVILGGLDEKAVERILGEEGL